MLAVSPAPGFFRLWPHFPAHQAAFCLSSNVWYHITLLCVCQQLFYFLLALFKGLCPVFQGEYYNSKRIPKSQPFFSLFFILFFRFFRQLNPVVPRFFCHNMAAAPRRLGSEQ